MRMSTACTSFCPKVPFMSLAVATSVGAPSAVGQLRCVIPAQTAAAAGSVSTRGRIERDPAPPLYAAGFAVFRGSGDLAWVKVTVDPAFVDQVLELQTRVVVRGLLHCAVSWTAQGWDGARPVEGTLASVHVNERSCWLRTHPQNQELANRNGQNGHRRAH